MSSICAAGVTSALISAASLTFVFVSVFVSVLRACAFVHLCLFEGHQRKERWTSDAPV